MARKNRGGGRLYIVHVVPGLEDLVRRRLEGAEVVRTLERFDERTSLVLFRYAGPPESLLHLRLVEDVFALACESEGIASSRVGLAAIRQVIARSAGFPAAVSIALELRRRRGHRPTFRVIARKSGEHAFRRVDMQRAVERAVLERFPGWRLVEDNAQLEIWVHLVEDLFIAGIRLSDIAMRQREGRRVDLPAALKPTIAAAMVVLSEPRDDDVFLDPMCGSGTILIERALAGRYRLLLGGDVDPQAVAAARENIGPKYKPIEIRQWDARRLPLDDESVTSVVSNLPFGKQIGTLAEMRALYPALFLEWRRVLAPGRTMVLLTSERDLLQRALDRTDGLTLERRLRVQVRGLWSTIFVVGKSATGPSERVGKER